MDFNDFQKNCVRLLSPETTVTELTQLINGALGVTGEGGELADMVKKHAFQGHALDVEKVKKELGDILFYVATAADAVGVTLQEVADANVEKLARRYQSGVFTSEESHAKRDEA